MTLSDILLFVLIIAVAAVIEYYLAELIVFVAPVISPLMYTGGYHRGAHESHPDAPTMRLDSEWIPAEVWERHLPGWTRTTGLRADLTYADSAGYSDKSLYEVRAKLKYRLNCRDLMDKARLHKILTAEDPTTICRTLIMGADDILPSGIWMIRLNTSTGGKNAVAVDNHDAFDELRREWVPRTKYERENSAIMASEYIVDPMLHEGRKFHIRLYMVVGVLPRKTAWLINEGLIIPAHEPYVAGDWNNAEIHDTHAKNNPLLEPIRPETHPKWFEKCRELMSRVMRVMINKVDKYGEGDAGYELFGVDIMLSADGVAKLIEVNSLPDISKNDPALNDMVCRGLVASAIHAVFPGDTPADPDAITELC